MREQSCAVRDFAIFSRFFAIFAVLTRFFVIFSRFFARARARSRVAHREKYRCAETKIAKNTGEQRLKSRFARELQRSSQEVHESARNTQDWNAAVQRLRGEGAARQLPLQLLQWVSGAQAVELRAVGVHLRQLLARADAAQPGRDLDGTPIPSPVSRDRSDLAVMCRAAAAIHQYCAANS